MIDGIIKFALAYVVTALRLPHRCITRDDGDPYLHRWYLCGEDGGLKYFPEGQRAKRWWQYLMTWMPCVYVHRFVSSDIDPELHNHPWTAVSLVLVGGYDEERRVDSISAKGGFKVVLQRIKPFMLNRLNADTFHRVLLIGDQEAWSIIKCGEKVQTWGFWSAETGEFVHHKVHAARKNRAAA
jgi:hypothetical protein